MSKFFVSMGEYYGNSDTIGLVRTIGRFTNKATGDVMIGYADVGEGGYVNDAYVMPESEFIAKYVI